VRSKLAALTISSNAGERRVFDDPPIGLTVLRS
jgi:hypothetical protein